MGSALDECQLVLLSLGGAAILSGVRLLLNGRDHVHIWRELERIEQRLSRGAEAAASQLYDTMGRPASQAFTYFGNHFVAGIARVDRVRQALEQSGPMARRLVEQQLSGIGIAAVWDILVAACKEIALYYGGSVVTGAVVGGAIGSAAFGVGAVPGAMIGTTVGAHVGTWVLALAGLKELAEGLGNMLPAALDHYERGFREAWGATSSERSDTWRGAAPASGNSYTGAWYMAQGHVMMVIAILTALVAYFTRGRGNKAALMQDIRKSPKLGPKFADWLAENERKLLGHPQLQARPSTPAGMAKVESLPTNGRGTSAPSTGAKAGPGRANTVDLAAQTGGPSGLRFPPTEGLGTHTTMAELRASGALPGERGVIITDRTVRFGDVYELGVSREYPVEFSLVTEYSEGKLVKKLYSGDAWTSPVPRDSRLIGHVHPNENDFKMWPSTQDMEMVNARYFRELMSNPNAAPSPTRIFWGAGNTDNTIFYPGFGKNPLFGKGG
jgi:hypothetical protein